jgi:hypothetical protein
MPGQVDLVAENANHQNLTFDGKVDDVVLAVMVHPNGRVELWALGGNPGIFGAIRLIA